MQATMGHLERKPNPKGGTVGDEISSSQNFDRLRMTRRGKADSFAAPYARHQILQNKKDMYISEDTHLLILSLITPVLPESFFKTIDYFTFPHVNQKQTPVSVL